MNGTITPGYYRHYKGKLHKVHFVGLHSETLEPQVCYESLYKNRKSQFLGTAFIDVRRNCYGQGERRSAFYTGCRP